jgi:hypothetical protein
MKGRCQFLELFFCIHQLDIHPFWQVLYGLTEDTVIRQLEKVFFKVITCVLPFFPC